MRVQGKTVKKPVIANMPSSKLRAFLAVVTFFSCHLILAQDALLWRISGNGLKKPSYLFGTIHIICSTDDLNKPILNACIDSCEVVALELNLFDYDTRVAMIKSQMKTTETTISSHLNANQKRLVDSTCLALLGDSLSVFDRKPPMNLMASLMGSQDFLGCQTPNATDIFIATLAFQKGKEQFGLETFGFQDSLLNNLSYSFQLAQLLEFCGDIDSAKHDFDRMLKLYNEQKIFELAALMISSSPEMSVYKKELLDDRNERWLQFLKDNMSETSLFMAVGSAHLTGTEGLIESLRKAGYTLTPIIIK